LAIMDRAGEEFAWPAMKARFSKCVVVLSTTFIAYAALRFVLEKSGAASGSRTLAALQHLNVLSYLSQFGKAVAVILGLAFAEAAWQISIAVITSPLASEALSFLPACSST